MRRGLVVLVGILVGATSAGAQESPHLTLGVTVSAIRRTARDAGVAREGDGLLAGGTVTGRAGRLSLTATYLEGRLSDDQAGTEPRYVEGSAAVMLRVAPWIAVGSGVRVHRVEEVDPERWITWGAGARVDLPLLGPVIRGHATYFQGLGGEVNFPESTVDARSGEVGMTFGLPGHPFQFDLTTRVEQNNASGRTRTSQQLALGLGWNLR